MALRKRRPGLVYPTWEDWHYVGDTGEPAFQNSWGNSGATQQLGFRIRETGIVDIQGDISGGTALAVIFTLPVGYRPSANAFYSTTGYVSGGADEYLAATVNVTTAGYVNLSHRSTTPPDRFFISAQFFLTPSSAP